MRPTPLRRSALIAALLLIPSAPARPEGKATDDKGRAADALTLARQAADTYAFSAGEGATPMGLHAEPVLTWTNPILGAVYGDVFLWTEKGRPEVAACFVKWYHPFTHRTHEFTSLSTAPVVGGRAGQTVWTPTRPGAELKPVPGAPEPGGSPAVRLRQMRDLARQFTGRQTDYHKVERDLRLLNQPLYRYGKTEGDLVDGALFAFALGTDPDAFLLIEDRVVGGKAGWHYALARMTSLAMRISHQGRAVWDVPQADGGLTYGSHREPYTCFRVDE